jgi:phosphopantetheine adenylyltransferase
VEKGGIMINEERRKNNLPSVDLVFVDMILVSEE